MIDPLTLDQLRVLVAVADAGSFSAAARRLDRVQSAISQSVQTLEATLGLHPVRPVDEDPATDRRRARVVATPLADRFGGRAARPRPQHRRRRRAGTDARGRPDVPDTVLMESLQGAAQRLPVSAGNRVHRDARRGEQRLREGAARLAIYPLPASTPSDLSADFMTRSPWPVVAADHPLARGPSHCGAKRLSRTCSSC